MVRGGLTSYAHVSALAPADHLKGFCGGEMGHVILPAGGLGQLNIALDYAGFGLCRHAAQPQSKGRRAIMHGAAGRMAGIFGVLDHGNMQFGGEP